MVQADCRREPFLSLGEPSQQAPGSHPLVLPWSPPQRACLCSSPSQGAHTACFFPSLCVGDMWFYCQHGVSNERQMVSNVTRKKTYKQQQNYMFFFPVVFTGRICDLFAVNTAYNGMAHRSTAKCVRHSLYTHIKCNAIRGWRQSRWELPWAWLGVAVPFPWGRWGAEGKWAAAAWVWSRAARFPDQLWEKLVTFKASLNLYFLFNNDKSQ